MTLTEDNVADYADTLVRQMRAQEVPLDYSPESVAALERLIAESDSQTRTPDFPEAQRNLLVFYNGCYLGEVMARNLGGVWRFDPQNWADSTLVFPYGEGGLQVFPFLKLWLRLTEGPDENNLVAYYRGLEEKLAS
ncbi:MAG: hypothetical protein OHK0029_24320 [Armatimonadaceae bacterium]